MRVGYFLSCEEYDVPELLEQATLAEEAGFSSLWISDHFHPWNDAQGQSPFVWAVIGALSQTTTLPITTAVTCPTRRFPPSLSAQAAATVATMLPGGFRFGVGSGEALNEHIHGQRWPSAEIRLEMLDEAVGVIRRLWSGEFVNHRGTYYTVDRARLYTLPDQPPEIHVSAFGPKAAELAARIGDGLVTTSVNRPVLDRFWELAPSLPVSLGTKVAWAPSRSEGVELAHRLWGHGAAGGEAAQELPHPRHFEQLAESMSPSAIAEKYVCGSSYDEHAEQLGTYAAAGIAEAYVANIGPHYRAMIEGYGEHVLPRFAAR